MSTPEPIQLPLREAPPAPSRVRFDGATFDEALDGPRLNRQLGLVYRALADNLSCTTYIRVPALGTHPDFIKALCELVEVALWKEVTPGRGWHEQDCGPICPCLEEARA